MKKNRQATVQKFLNSAKEIIRTNGFDGLGVNTISNLAGADKVLLYRYFGNLDGLLLSLAKDTEFFPILDEESIFGAKEKSILSFVENYISFMDENLFSKKNLALSFVYKNSLTNHFLEQKKAYWQGAFEYFKFDDKRNENAKHFFSMLENLVDVYILSEDRDFCAIEYFIGKFGKLSFVSKSKSSKSSSSNDIDKDDELNKKQKIIFEENDEDIVLL